jgi:hypothetical protein
VDPISARPAQMAIFNKSFISHTCEKTISIPFNRRGNSFELRTYKSVHSKRFEVAENQTHSQKLGGGSVRVISPAPIPCVLDSHQSSYVRS